MADLMQTRKRPTDKDCCELKSVARNNGYFEGPVGDYWFHDRGPPCEGWPKPTLWSRIKKLFS